MVRQTPAAGLNRATSRNAGRKKGSADKTFHAGTCFAIRFLLACLLLYGLLELAPDLLYAPVNRLNTTLAGRILNAMGFAAETGGISIALEGFRAQVIGECSAVFLSVLPLAFIWAFPSGMNAKLTGWTLGLVFLFVVNLLRIDLLVVAGAKFPRYFQMIHLYCGQVLMVLTVLVICLGWLKYLRGGESHRFLARPLIRFILMSVPAFAFWWLFSGPYTRFLYHLIQTGSGWLGIHVTVPSVLKIYPDTFKCFNWVTFSALAWSFSETPVYKRLRFWLTGMASLSAIHAAFTLLYILFVVYRLTWLMGAINICLVLNEWVLPFGLWLFHRRGSLTATSASYR